MDSIKYPTEIATETITNIVIDICKKAGGNLTKLVEDKQVIAQAVIQYSKEYQNRYGLRRFLGISQAMRVESVNLEVRLLDEVSKSRFKSIKTLERTYRKDKQHNIQTEKYGNQDGIAVANKHQYLMILGGPGTGKTTFLRQIGLDALKGEEGKFKHRCIPVALDLKRHATRGNDLQKSIVEEFRDFGFLLSKELIVKALEQGKLLVLLDGLDEVSRTQRDVVINSIRNFVHQYDQNRFVISCRIAIYKNSFRRFKAIELAEFNDIQIKQFIDNWFQSDLDRQSKTADKCIEALNKANNAVAKELARIPLLLSFLCLVYDRHLSFPNKQSTLYRTTLDILLREWDADKWVKPSEINQKLNIDLEKILLSEIAYQSFTEDKLFFSQKHLVKHIKDFLEDTINKPEYSDWETVLNVIIQQGILVEQVQSIYSFTHHTLQEYLTAQYIVDNNKIEWLVTQHLTDARWREVFVLVAGLMRGRNGADKLLLLMEQEAQDYISTSKWQNLLHWADKVTAGSEGQFQPVAKRIAAIFLPFILAIDLTQSRDLVYAFAHSRPHGISSALSLSKIIDLADALSLTQDLNITLCRAFNHTRAIVHVINDSYSQDQPIDNTFVLLVKQTFDLDFDFNLTLADKLKEFKIFNYVNWDKLIKQLKDLEAKFFDSSQSDEMCRTFHDHLLQIWCDALHLNPKIAKLSRQELEALANYLSANRLIVQCKKSAVRVSTKTWKTIETRILLASDN